MKSILNQFTFYHSPKWRWKIILLLCTILTLTSSANFAQETDQDEAISAEHSRNLGQKFGLAGALLGVFSVALAYMHQVKKVRHLNKELSAEKEKSDNLLLNILPASIAEELKSNGKATAKSHENVSVLFTDFKDFTKVAETLTASELVDELDECFKAFDAITEKYKIEKIKVIGDAYMAAGGLTNSENSATNTVNAALEMQECVKQRRLNGKAKFEMRIGIHTGHVTSGVVGSRKFQYDIWGDTVNIASRMESSGEVGKVNISAETFKLINNNKKFQFEQRGQVAAKNKGEIEMYFVVPR